MEEWWKQRHFPFVAKQTKKPHMEQDKEGVWIVGKPVHQGDDLSQPQVPQPQQGALGRRTQENKEAKRCRRPGGRCTAPGN